MSGIFDENNMKQILGKYLPEGEVLKAGIHGIGLDVRISQIFRNCTFDGEEFMPAEQGETFQIGKSKAARFDVYIGITQQYLLLAPCEREQWLYEINEIPDSPENVVREINRPTPLADIGTCFPLADIQSCGIKKVWMGAVNCTIALKDGSSLKLQLPKLGGLGGGMPHHAEYREEIIRCLSEKQG